MQKIGPEIPRGPVASTQEYQDIKFIFEGEQVNMKTSNISELSILPEEYGKSVYEKIGWSVAYSEMTGMQNRFING